VCVCVSPCITYSLILQTTESPEKLGPTLLTLNLGVSTDWSGRQVAGRERQAASLYLVSQDQNCVVASPRIFLKLALVVDSVFSIFDLHMCLCVWRGKTELTTEADKSGVIIIFLGQAERRCGEVEMCELVES
jgi:hypothetical protein